MSLQEQILSFSFSILFGIINGILYIKIKKYIYFYKKRYIFLNSLLYNNILTIIYFKSIYLINGGVANIYFIALTILSFLISVKKFTKKMSNKV